jgi:hypothetical protein
VLLGATLALLRIWSRHTESEAAAEDPVEAARLSPPPAASRHKASAAPPR